MFCWKCGKVIGEGEELCQGCLQQDSVVNTVGQWLQDGKRKLKKIGGDTLDSSIKEIQKAVEKKTKQAANKAMKAVGLKKKTPLDKAKDMWKEIKK